MVVQNQNYKLDKQNGNEQDMHLCRGAVYVQASACTWDERELAHTPPATRVKLAISDQFSACRNTGCFSGVYSTGRGPSLDLSIQDYAPVGVTQPATGV
jgi:hypothetical protein